MIARLCCAAAVVLALSAGSAVAQTAKALIQNAEGATIGNADLIEVSDGVLIKLTVKGLPAGEHAFHVHAVGKCEPPFTTAGGHFNPGNHKHGMMAPEGHHAGDMPNLIVPASGEVAIEVVNTAVTLAKDKPNSLFKPDGTALVIHGGPDDYKSDPAGNAGARIACGVIEP